MTEAELRNSNWGKMYWFICDQDSQRKRILAFVACCRSTWSHVSLECNRKALATSEKYADGEATLQELEINWRRARFEPIVYCEWFMAVAGPLDDGTVIDISPHTDEDYQALATFEGTVSKADREEWSPERIAFGLDVFGHVFRDATFDPSWRTSTVHALARQMYQTRDFSPMPILADALQDAGCDNDDILDHCRGPGPHVRGCWVVDLVLGKS